MFTLTYVYVEYETRISSWDIWNYVRTKMIVLHLFNLTKWFNSQNPYETEIHNKIWHINPYISNWHFELPTPKKWGIRIYFCSIQDYWRPSTWKSLLHNQWSEMERCEKRAFQHKMRKKNISCYIKNKYVTEVWVRSSSMKDYTCHYGVSIKSQTATLFSTEI